MEDTWHHAVGMFLFNKLQITLCFCTLFFNHKGTKIKIYGLRNFTITSFCSCLSFVELFSEIPKTNT